MRSTILSLVTFGLSLTFVTHAVAQTQLVFEIPSELKKANCGGDDDGDCLDQASEASLAFIVSPHYFYDEDENCAGASYLSSPNPLHYGRRDFYQVRPYGSDVSTWQPNNGTIKQVQITYFLAHPHDCNGFGGHQGDGEHVRFRLQSVNLKTWTLIQGEYHHHNYVHFFSGQYLKNRATEIGTIYPSVAADEDGHGSWPGRVGSSSNCAGSEDDFCYFGTCDCFVGTMASAFANRKWEYPSTTRNIGGPSPERFRSSVVTVSGSAAFSTRDVGHGSNIEYWTPRTDKFKTFCGWECSSRKADGNCFTYAHNETECSTPLSAKVDTTSFTNSNAVPSVHEYNPSESYDSFEMIESLAREDLSIRLDSLAWLTPEELESWKWEAESNADPVGLFVPMLQGWPHDQQLVTLKWIASLPGGKAEAALDPEFLSAIDLNLRGEVTLDLLNALISMLESSRVPAVLPNAEEGGCNAVPISGGSPAALLGMVFSLLALCLFALRRGKRP